MASITANGATEICRVRAKNPKGHPYIYVMTSDGRILVQWDHPHQTFSLFRKDIPEDRRNERTLFGILTILHMREIRVVPSVAGSVPEVTPVVPPKVIRKPRPRDFRS